MDKNELRAWICRQYGSTSASRILQIADCIDVYADLMESDVFLDCFLTEHKGIVIAHGRPKSGSLYQTDITGAEVFQDKEPMVFLTRDSGIAGTDARALSQENLVVRQRTVPIEDESGAVIAVLILERDDSERVSLNRKLDHMEEFATTLAENMIPGAGMFEETEMTLDYMFAQETHHRIKNNLQTISSILSLQQRRCCTDEAREILNTDIGMINSLASMYEIIMTGGSEDVDFFQVLRRMIGCIEQIYADKEPPVEITLEGDPIFVPQNKIHALTVIANELIQNAYKHGKFQDKGKISVQLLNGNMYASLRVTDNGVGYQEEVGKRQHLGLTIVRMLTKDPLRGSFIIEAIGSGTAASVHFPL